VEEESNTEIEESWPRGMAVTTTTVTKPPIAAYEKQPAQGTAAATMNMAGGRRPSRSSFLMKRTNEWYLDFSQNLSRCIPELLTLTALLIFQDSGYSTYTFMYYPGDHNLVFVLMQRQCGRRRRL
jgi:hypothetical protein